jgi:[CysO sulfur-carrier protein]-S-L-cysteine hydrolase
VRIPRELLDELVDHARREAPNECCGMITAKDGVATRVYPATNAKASPLAFEIADREQIRISYEIDDNEERDGQLAGVYHSHTRTEPDPSLTDRNFAKLWGPGIEWVIVGLDGDDARVRSYLIEDGQVREVPIE